MKKFKLIFIGWLLYSTLLFIGWRIEFMTYEWCLYHNHESAGKVTECAERLYTSWYHLGRAMQFNPVAYLFYFAISIIDKE